MPASLRPYVYLLFNLVTFTQAHELVNMKILCPTIVCDIRYATENNFTKQCIYNSPGCYLHKDAAIALKKVVDELAQEGLGIKIFDAYRPLSAQWKLWHICPDPRYVSDPRKGGRHTRGTAVDLTLIHLHDGGELAMPTEFDCFDKRAWISYTNLPEKIIANRTKLQTIMRKHGFTTIKTEWWHFDLKDFTRYAILDIAFESM